MGRISECTVTLVVPDPDGQHIGSGTATLNAILALPIIITRTNSETLAFSTQLTDDFTSTSSDRNSPVCWPANIRSPYQPTLSRFGGISHNHRLDQKPTDFELEMMKERFSKLLLGEDMFGSGKGVSTAVTIFDAITSVYTEDRDQSEGNDGISGATRSPGSDGLMAEVNFLKACGILLQTPVEIKSIKKLNDSQPQSGNMEATFQSWLPNTTTTEKALEKQPDHFLSPIKLFEEWEENKSDSASHSPNSYTAGKSTDTTSSSDGCEVIDHVKDSST